DLIRTVGVTFIGPLVLALEATLTDDADRRAAALEEAEAILDSGCVAHNHFWFARAAIDQALASRDWDRAERYAARLESYTRAEPLPWSNYLIARGRAAAAWGRGSRSPELTAELERVRGLGARHGLKHLNADLE